MDYWQPAVTALLFFVAQVLVFLAITRGDVSVAAPVLGAKVIFVTCFAHCCSRMMFPGSGAWGGFKRVSGGVIEFGPGTETSVGETNDPISAGWFAVIWIM